MNGQDRILKAIGSDSFELDLQAKPKRRAVLSEVHQALRTTWSDLRRRLHLR